MHNYGLVVLKNSTYRSLTDQTVEGTWIESVGEIKQMLANRPQRNRLLSLVTEEEEIGYQKSSKISLIECNQEQRRLLADQRRKNSPRLTPF